MRSQTVRLMAALAIAVLTSAPLIAGDSPRCGLLGAADATPAGMSAAWLSSLQAVLDAGADLSPEQRTVIARAVQLGTPKTFALKANPDQHLVLPKLARVIRDAKQVFSTDQLGEIFSRMGPAQEYLSTFGELGTPYCNCTGVGDTCEMGPGGPSGECETGCISWTGSDGEHRVAICSGDTEVE